MNNATIAVVIAGVIVGLILFGARLLLVFDVGERRVVNHDRGPR